MARMKTTACIFDLDGTLLDSAEDIAHAVHQTLLDHNLPVHSLAEYRSFVGNGMLRLVQRAAPTSLPHSAIDELLAATKARYSTCWAMKTRAYPGVHEALRFLCENRVAVMVLSNKPDEFTGKMVRYFFPDIPFADIRGQREGVPVKPAPDAALEMLRNTGADRTFFVGDLPVDILTGRGAGTTTIGVTWGFNPASLAESCPDRTVHSAEEMVAVILGK